MLYGVVLLVVVQRLVELAIAARNTARLRQAGAVEYGARHYPLFILLHGTWLASVALLIPADQAANLWLLSALIVLLLARFWVMTSLGPYWTTRIIRLPHGPIVSSGPYRWVRHPNYLIVTGEIAVLPLVFGAWKIAIVFSLLNALLLRHRIRIENAALGETT